MKNIKIIFLCLLIAVASFQVGYCQPPDATANFVKVEKEITTTPEFPGICNPDVGIQITINETFLKYLWTSPSGTTIEGKTIVLKESGKWKIEVTFIENNIECKRTKELLVADLSDPFEIKRYFDNAGFWPIQIYRQALFNPEPIPCRNCNCDAELESVSFSNGGDFLKLTNEFENFSDFRPFQGMDYQKNITNNSCLCNGDGTTNIPEFENSLGSGELSVWGHQFFKNPNTLGGTLYLKASMSWQASSPVDAHRTRLNAIKSQIIAQNPGINNQARVLFTNLFMNQPIGGYDLIPTCPDPEGCFADGNFLTPAGVAIKLPNDSHDFIFAPSSKPDGVFEGALIGMTDGTGKRIGYHYKSGNFAGYYHDISAKLKDGLETIQTAPDPNEFYTNLPIKSNDDCKVIINETNLNTTSETSYGGISEKIANFDPVFVLISSGFKNADNETISFLSGNAKIISVPYDQLQNLKFVYDAGIGDVATAATGLLWEFELVDEMCNVEKYTFDNNSSYVYKGKVYEDKTNDISIDNFVYLMNCNGQFEHFGINRGSLLQHDNLGENYTNNFNDLTSFFIPFSSQYPWSFQSGPATINGACAFCPNEEFSNIIIKDSYCTEPEQIFVEKIAQLATVYPDYFKDFNGVLGSGTGVDPACYLTFTQKTNWEVPITGPNIPISWWSWRQFLENNPNIASSYQNDNVLFFKTFIDKFLDELDGNDSWWNQDIASKTVEEIICHLSGEAQSITSAVPWTKKLIALNKLYTAVSNPDAQYGIIHLLAASPSEMISHVEGKTIQYYWDNFNSSEDNDNRSRMVNLICSKSNGMYVDMHQYHVNPLSMPALEANIWNFNNLNPVIGANFVTLNGPLSASVRDYTDIIPVKISKKFTIGGHEFQEGLILYVPSLQAALYAVKNQKAVEDRLAWAAVDLGLLALGVGSYKYVWTTANYLRKGFIVADVVGSVLGVTAQLLDNIDDDTRTKIQLAALVASGPEIGINIAEAVSSTRLLRDKKPNYRPAILSADEIRLALAKKDLQGFDDTWDFVRTNPRGTDAWEMLIDYELFRRNTSYIQNINDYYLRTGDTYTKLLDDFSEFNGTKKIFLDELADTPASGIYHLYPDGVWNLNPTRRGREIETALGSNLHTNFPWIDKFDDVNLVATSIKSTDTYSSSYQNAGNLESLWKSYVDDLASMPAPNVPITFAGKTVMGYNKQVLEIAIPDPLVGFQETVKDNLVAYAKGKGHNGKDIDIIITVIE